MTCKRLTVPTLLVHPALKSVLKGLMAANNGGSPISVLGVGTPRGHNLTKRFFNGLNILPKERGVL